MCTCKNATAQVLELDGETMSALEPAVGVRLVKGCGMPGPWGQIRGIFCEGRKVRETVLRSLRRVATF